MTVEKYQEAARRTQPDGMSDQDKLFHAVFGLNSEAGEVAGIFQKIYQGHSVDENHLIRELGDCLWMISEACDALKVQMGWVMEVNIMKLEERYPNGFSAENSLHRKEGDV